ncbi:unnamed protein product [Candidula unifasciata]|uniref:C-type lectin domain-containing protein n=1 Tax=Candidula unifasciata TaxID=100452 RepID=A0A8S3ZX12_9EUPU|nr:unnamed protein product [Candidula unifasciata]
MYYIFSAEVAAAEATDVCPPAVPRDEYLQVYGDFCYQFVIYRQRSYSQADQDCRRQGGILAVVKSQDITDYFVDQLLNKYGYADKVWIGLNDKDADGALMWEDGTSPGYSNWAPGQGPRSTHTTNIQGCVTLVPSLLGKWDDDSCGNGIFGVMTFTQNRFSYICQFHARRVTTSATAVSCAPFVCDIDCGEEQYIKDPDYGCPTCQCGSA